MEQYFSAEFKELIAKSRLIAIDLGYDYITTVHFFLADCESGKPNSIFNFAFSDRGAYQKFKEECRKTNDDWLATTEDDLPLTKEAAKAIMMTDTERLMHKQTMSYPSHFFLAAFHDKESILWDCFRNTPDVKQKLEGFYTELGEFEKSKMPAAEISKQYYVPGATTKKKWYEIWK